MSLNDSRAPVTRMRMMVLSDATSSFRIALLEVLPSHDGVIELEVRTRQGSWSTLDPGLERNDLRALARWLMQLAKGRRPQELGFMEPNLRFECLSRGDEPIRIRVWFEGEARPEWAPWENWGMEDFWLDLTVTRAEVSAAAESLTGELARKER
jgi:hypothetical protein